LFRILSSASNIADHGLIAELLALVFAMRLVHNGAVSKTPMSFSRGIH
jgi:hypothetical protein